jgi:hypothetical protein
VLVRSIFLLLFLFSPLLATDDFIVTPIPKCGTNLIHRAICLLTGKQVMQMTGGGTNDLIDSLQIAKKHDSVITIHHYSDYFCPELKKRNYKNIFFCRDPRDACVSLVVYLDTKQGEIRDFFVVPDNWDILSFDEKLYCVIVGKNCDSYLGFWYERLSQWAAYPGTLIIRFEDLVGSKGGGKDILQKQSLMAIASYLNLVYYAELVDEVSKILYNPETKVTVYDGRKFIPGKIGSWKTFFNKKNRAAFKKHYNHLLVKFQYENNLNW